MSCPLRRFLDCVSQSVLKMWTAYVWILGIAILVLCGCFPRTVTIWVPKGHSLNKLFLLKTCQTQRDFANLLGYSEKEFTLILFSQPIQNKYQSFDIPKKNGHKRNILAPSSDLKTLQNRLSTLLTNCYEELEKKRLTESSYVHCISSHGFRKNLLLDIPFSKKSRIPFETKLIKLGIYIMPTSMSAKIYY